MKFYFLYVHSALVLTTIIASQVNDKVQEMQLETGEYEVATSYQPS